MVTGPEETTDPVVTAFAKYGCVWGRSLMRSLKVRLWALQSMANCSQIMPQTCNTLYQCKGIHQDVSFGCAHSRGYIVSNSRYPHIQLWKKAFWVERYKSCLCIPRIELKCDVSLKNQNRSKGIAPVGLVWHRWFFLLSQTHLHMICGTNT